MSLSSNLQWVFDFGRYRCAVCEEFQRFVSEHLVSFWWWYRAIYWMILQKKKTRLSARVEYAPDWTLRFSRKELHASMGWMHRSRSPRNKVFLLPQRNAACFGVDYFFPVAKPEGLFEEPLCLGKDYHKRIERLLRLCKKLKSLTRFELPTLESTRPFIERPGQ